jgi:CelD/BcsL family acetyltransferase involved in cellulose biosynthesis
MHAPLKPALRVEWRAISALESIIEQWRSLIARALEPNVFYDPAFALAAAPAFGERCGAVLVWSARGLLMGLFPARIARWRDGALPTITGWTHPYAPLGTPLVDRAEAEAVIAAWLEYLARDPAMPALLLLPMLPDGGLFATALGGVLSHKRMGNATFGRHHRAMIESAAQSTLQLEQAIPAHRRKELQRQRRRLEEIGPVTFAAARERERIESAVEDFLVLEASGWKGVARTAAANDPVVRRFLETAVTALAAQGQARVDRMMLGGRTIAAAITLTAGDTAWFWKIAYNEGVARFSPGVQLVHQLTPILAGQPGTARVDSCATADHPMIDRMWPGRLALSDRLIAVKPSVLPFSVACRAEAFRRAAVAAAKGLRDRLRPRRTKAASSPGAQQPADDLAGGGHRHLRDEVDLARILMRGQPGAHKALDVGGKRV